jgi:hypothetical protein
MSCNDKISDRCPNKTNAKCVSYEGTFSNESALSGNCNNIETIIEDINTQLNYLRDTTYVELLKFDNCIQYVDQEPYNVVTPKIAIFTLNEKVKELMTFVGLSCEGTVPDCPAVFSQDISCLNLDFGALTDPCGTQPSTLKDVLQLMLNELQPQP